jgi:hypothetical protein
LHVALFVQGVGIAASTPPELVEAASSPPLPEPLVLPEASSPIASSPPSLGPSSDGPLSSDVPLDELGEPDEPDDPDEEASSFVPLGVVSLALLPPPLAPEVVPGAAPRSVDPPLAHAAPTASTASAPIAVLLEKLVEERLARCTLLSTARTLA